MADRGRPNFLRDEGEDDGARGSRSDGQGRPRRREGPIDGDVEATLKKLAYYDSLDDQGKADFELITLMDPKIFNDEALAWLYENREDPDHRESVARTQGCRDFRPEMIARAAKSRRLDGADAGDAAGAPTSYRVAPSPSPAPGAVPVVRGGPADATTGRQTAAPKLDTDDKLAGAPAPDDEMARIINYAQQLGYTAEQLDQDQAVQDLVLEGWEEYRRLLGMAETFGFTQQQVDQSETLQDTLIEIFNTGREHLQELGFLRK